MDMQDELINKLRIGNHPDLVRLLQGAAASAFTEAFKKKTQSSYRIALISHEDPDDAKKNIVEPEQSLTPATQIDSSVKEARSPTDQAEVLRMLMAGKKAAHVTIRRGAYVIAVASGKGGVGKSTVTANLGIALARKPRHVVVVDGDLGLANLDIMFGVRPAKTLWHYINAGTDLSEILIRNAFGVDLLPGGSGFEDLANLSPSQLDRLVVALETIESQSDYIIIDTGAGIGHRVTAFAAAADLVIVVAAPESTAVLDAYGLIKATCNHHPGQKFGVVMCRASDRNEAKRHFNALRTVTEQYTSAAISLLGIIPSDESARASVNQHQPLIALYPRSSASNALVRLSQTVMQYFEKEHRRADTIQETRIPARSGFISRLLGSLKPKAL